MKLILTTLFLVFTVTIFAQKIEKTDNSRTSDFTTTPFQDGSTAKGVNQLFTGFHVIEDDTYEEGDVKILVPTSFNPNNSSFSIDGNIAVFKLCIYDMEGNKVYEGKMENSWNGIRDNGSKITKGLYVYTVEGRITPGRTSKFAGFVTVK
ncbi:MAG: hypothetical protein HC803_09780 [Saprospiraceae bacterium]|nr:hypothetical protein [Saprospiraceae bacterium]